jgi:hypothetical protein
VADDGGAAELLQRKAKVAIQRERQHWFEEHDAGRVFVVFEQAGDGGGGVDAGIVRIEAELVVELFDAGVQGAAIFAEGHGEEEVFLGGVAQEEGAWKNNSEMSLQIKFYKKCAGLTFWLALQ